MAEMDAKMIQYGTVERVYIARDVGTPAPVFVKFNSPLSALRVGVSPYSYGWKLADKIRYRP